MKVGISCPQRMTQTLGASTVFMELARTSQGLW